MQSPNQMDINRDTLNFRTFPDYLLDIVKDDENLDTRLYPLNESNTSANNWCDTLLVQYNGNCPNKERDVGLLKNKNYKNIMKNHLHKFR